MPSKNVRVEMTQGNSFKTECAAGRHRLVIDQPAAAGGTDAGPTPLDYQLIAVGGCVTAIGRIIANQRRLPVRGIQVTVDGQLNTDGLLGKGGPDRVGFASVQARVVIDADLSREQKEALLHEIDQRCPISDNLQNATPVSVTLAD